MDHHYKHYQNWMLIKIDKLDHKYLVKAAKRGQTTIEDLLHEIIEKHRYPQVKMTEEEPK